MDVDETRKKKIREYLVAALIAAVIGIALGVYLGVGTGPDVRDQRRGTDTIGTELERAVDRERRAAGDAHELAGDAEGIAGEIDEIREELGNAEREAGLAVEGTDRADILIGECQSIIAGVRARGAKD